MSNHAKRMLIEHPLMVSGDNGYCPMNDAERNICLIAGVNGYCGGGQDDAPEDCPRRAHDVVVPMFENTEGNANG